MARRRVGFGLEETAPIFARIPKSEAEKLHRAALATGTSKQRIIAGLLAEHLEPPVPGAHDFRPFGAVAEVLTLEEAAELLRVEEVAVEELAHAGRIPGRRLGGEWRFARAALLEWLGGADTGAGPFEDGAQRPAPLAQAASGSGTSPRAEPASR